MDPALLQLLEAGRGNDEVAAIVRLRPSAVLPSQLRQVVRFGDIVTVRLRRRHIPAIRYHDSVLSMKAPRPLHPERKVEAAEDAVPNYPTYSDERRSSLENATGRGVVVGVIDWGLDFAHPNFRRSDGQTRLLALWDQSAPPGPATPDRYGYGVVHSSPSINNALSTADPYTALGYNPADSDPDGVGAHGTLVTDIAAGNGRGGGPAGVAPASSLVFVQLVAAPWEPGMPLEIGDSATLLEAVDFVARTAGRRPWVINLSMGRCGEQHDGTTLVEQGLDAAVTAARGRAIIQSTGNYYGSCLHETGQLRPGQRRILTWCISPSSAVPNQLEVWYPGRDVVLAELRAPDGKLAADLVPGARVRLLLGGRHAGMAYHRLREPNNLANHIFILLTSARPPGTWLLTLAGTDVVDGRWHAWIEREPGTAGSQSRFPQQEAVPSFSTGSICNGLRTLAVGAYNGHSPDRQVADYSSSGPTRDGRLKPDLVAPGVAVLAARSAPAPDSAGAGLLARRSGTSVAAPHVTGTVALMLEAAAMAPSIEDLHNLLLVSTQAPPATSGASIRYGSGYLDVDQAVRVARAFRGPIPAPPARDGSQMTDRRATVMVTFQHPRSADAAESSALPSQVVALDCVGKEVPAAPWRAAATPQNPAVTQAGEVVGAGRLSSVSPAALFASALSEAGLGRFIAPREVMRILHPALLFSAYTSPRFGAARSYLDRIFSVVALPRQRLHQALHVGDVLVRPPGRGAGATFALIASPAPRPGGTRTRYGAQPGAYPPGMYAHVVEAGPAPQVTARAPARLITDARGYLPANTLILRPKLSGRAPS